MKLNVGWVEGGWSGLKVGRILDVLRAAMRDIFRILKFEDLTTRIDGSQADHMPTKNHTN